MNGFVYFLLICFLPIACVAQKRAFVYKDVGDNLISSNFSSSYLKGNPASLSARFEKGEKDYTKIIQELIDRQDTVVLPNHPLNISYPGLRLRSNLTLVFQSESALILTPNDRTHYEMLNLDNIENVTIINPQLVGDREKHLGTQGEWGMGINILSSNNIKILNPRISKCWGDGIYVGRNKTKKASSNIEIIGGIIDFNRRNGISIISVENLTIDNTIISNTYGTMPMSGIDVEPNRDDEILKNIVFNDIKTINNFSEGIKIVFANILNPNDKIDIKIQNHHDIQSTKALTLVGIRPEHTNKRSLVSGAVEIVSPKWEGNLELVEFQKDMNLPVKVSVRNGRVVKSGSIKRFRKAMLSSVNRGLITIN